MLRRLGTAVFPRRRLAPYRSSGCAGSPPRSRTLSGRHLSPQVLACKRPSAWSQLPVSRLVGEKPSNCQRKRRAPDVGPPVPRATSRTFGPLKGFNLRALKNDLGAPADLQHVAWNFKINEHQPGLGIEQQIAQGIEVQVASKVRDGQALPSILTKPAWPPRWETSTADARHPHPRNWRQKRCRASAIMALSRIVQFIEELGRTCCRILQGTRLILPQLDVLRADAARTDPLCGKSSCAVESRRYAH